MLTLAMAILIASLLGSMHCVGMCGPLALWATGGGEKKSSMIAYHLGRLTTYLSAGLIAGVLGSALTIGGDIAGLQSLAAKLAGGVLIFVGLLRLFQMVPFFQRPAQAAEPSWIAGLLHRVRPLVAGFGPGGRAYFGGVLTTWLPCGWLYLFVLVAAGTGSVIPAMVVMSSFWVGTLPALTAVILGARTLMPRFKSVVPFAAGVLLIVAGLYTATGRAAADLSSMVPPKEGIVVENSSSLVGLAEHPLPCCEEPVTVAKP